MFHTNNNGETPFKLACRKYGTDVVMNLVNRVSTNQSHDNDGMIRNHSCVRQLMNKKTLLILYYKETQLCC